MKRCWGLGSHHHFVPFHSLTSGRCKQLNKASRLPEGEEAAKMNPQISLPVPVRVTLFSVTLNLSLFSLGKSPCQTSPPPMVFPSSTRVESTALTFLCPTASSAQRFFPQSSPFITIISLQHRLTHWDFETLAPSSVPVLSESILWINEQMRELINQGLQLNGQGAPGTWDVDTC